MTVIKPTENLKKQVSKCFLKSNTLLPGVLQPSGTQILRVCSPCSTKFYFHPHAQCKFLCSSGLHISHSITFYYIKYCSGLSVESRIRRFCFTHIVCTAEYSIQAKLQSTQKPIMQDELRERNSLHAALCAWGDMTNP